ncbi:hypothetical protein, partial [Blautia sp. TF10-30]|uniref:hypothetical protein n=1 Tax=Blautia sp. TF10-30 TaxID=2292986 RepID=UPI001A9BBD92
FLARKDEVKCLHSLLIIMGYFLGQHNPSNYFALTIKNYPFMNDLRSIRRLFKKSREKISRREGLIGV